MKTIYHVSLEKIENRYTEQWYTVIGELVNKEIGNRTDEYRYKQIDGEEITTKTTPGAFINFAATNYYKSTQLKKIAELFSNGEVKDGDYFLFTDAWNPAILNTKYMIDLHGLKVKIGAWWHAGGHDPQDFLGRLIKDKRWTNNTERALFYAIDHNFYATKFYINMFGAALLREDGWNKKSYEENIESFRGKIVRSGQPHDGLIESLGQQDNTQKENIIVFPHRLAPEKNVEIFRDLKVSMEESKWEWIITQEGAGMTNVQFHSLLSKSKLVFSANLQETLGISTNIQAPLTNNIPIAPNRLSYREIYRDYPEFTYPTEWTWSIDNYMKHKDKLITYIRDRMDNYEEYLPRLQEFTQHTIATYATSQPMLDAILGKQNV